MAETDPAAISDALAKLIGDSGILNPNVKVADLLSTSIDAAAITGTTAGGAQANGSGDFFIHTGYVYFRRVD